MERGERMEEGSRREEEEGKAEKEMEWRKMEQKVGRKGQKGNEAKKLFFR